MTHSMASLLEAYYLDLRVKNWSEGTISRRQYGLKRFVNWLADRSIDTFNDNTVQYFHKSRLLLVLGYLTTTH